MLVFFHANFLLDHFCAFPLEHALTSQVTFSLFRASFLRNLYCSHSEVKLVAKISSISALQKEETDSRVGREVHGSNPVVVNYFCNHKEKFI